MSEWSGRKLIQTALTFDNPNPLPTVESEQGSCLSWWSWQPGTLKGSTGTNLVLRLDDTPSDEEMEGSTEMPCPTSEQ